MKRAIAIFVLCIALTIVGGALGSPWLAYIGLLATFCSAVLIVYSIDTNAKG